MATAVDQFIQLNFEESLFFVDHYKDLMNVSKEVLQSEIEVAKNCILQSTDKKNITLNHVKKVLTKQTFPNLYKLFQVALTIPISSSTSFITIDLVGKIVFETNRYAKEQPINSEHSRMVYWKDIKICEYWSTNNLLSRDVFGKCVSRDRYLLLLRCIHFCDNSQQIKGDRLYKIQMILTEVRKNFKDAMIPFSNLAIDESLLLWKGRLSFKQYIKSKRRRLDIKLYIICDCETDFILNFIVYTGATEHIDPLEDILGKSGVIVKDLIKPYINKGYSLFTDNFYTSPKLSMYLHKRKTNTCGTVRKNRKLMPIIEGKLKLGEIEARCTDKLLAIHWKNRRDVYMLTSMNTNEMVDTKKIDRKTGKKYLKPQSVVSYNKNMGAIDKTDMLLSSTECVR
ncbi:hypothetical protein QTP88_027153 [Uroleucon formosanum]